MGSRANPNYHHIGSEMTLDNVPLTALAASEQQASLAALPEDLWRKIASLARPPTVRALVAACPDASLRSALRTDIDRAERAAFGLTQREAEPLLVDPLRSSLERPRALELPGHCPTLSVRLGTLLRTTLPHRRDRSRLRRTAS